MDTSEHVNVVLEESHAKELALLKKNKSVVIGEKTYTYWQCFANALTWQNADTWYHRGLALANSGDDVGYHDETGTYTREQCFAKVLTFQHTDAWFKLCFALAADDDERGAIVGGKTYSSEQCFAEARRPTFRNAEVWYDLGLSLADGDPGHVVVVGEKTYTREQCFAQTIALDGEHAEAWYNLGLAAGDRGKNVVVRPKFGREKEYTRGQCFANAVTFAPQHAEAWYNLGLVLADGGDVVVGGETYTRRECFVKAVTFNPQHTQAWYNLGLLALADGGGGVDVGEKTYTRRECFAKILTFDDQHSGAWYGLGLLDGGVVGGQVNTRQQCFVKALALNPQHAEAWYHIGLGLADGADISMDLVGGGGTYTRRNCFVKALTFDDQHAEAWYNLGLLSEDGGTDGAEEVNGQQYTREQCFKKAVRFNPRHADAWYNLGLAKWKFASRNESKVLGLVPARELHPKMEHSLKECFIEALTADPQHAGAWYNLGLLLYGWFSWSTVDIGEKTYTREQCFVQAVAFNDQHAEAWYNWEVQSGDGSKILHHVKLIGYSCLFLCRFAERMLCVRQADRLPPLQIVVSLRAPPFPLIWLCDFCKLKQAIFANSNIIPQLCDRCFCCHCSAVFLECAESFGIPHAYNGTSQAFSIIFNVPRGIICLSTCLSKTKTARRRSDSVQVRNGNSVSSDPSRVPCKGGEKRQRRTKAGSRSS